MYFLKRYCVVAMVVWLSAAGLAGCYSPEEKEQAKVYEEQGTVNAVNYIKEKYGFDAKVLEAKCERVGDLDPTPGETVFVTMEREGKAFTVQIDGDCETTEGFDNYRQEEILNSLEARLPELTGLSQEEVFVFYGESRGGNTLEDNKNGLVAPQFDGENLKEIFESGSGDTVVVVSYINQDIKTVDAAAVKEAIGATELLLVDYDSKSHYEFITQPWYNAEGTPADQSMKQHFPYINAYVYSERKQTVYTDCTKTTVDGILFVTENSGERISAEKIAGFTNEPEKKDRKRISSVYALTTDSDVVWVYVPTEMLSETGGKTPGFVVMKEDKEVHTTDSVTNDGAYVGTTIYRDEYDGVIEFALYVRAE